MSFYRKRSGVSLSKPPQQKRENTFFFFETYSLCACIVTRLMEAVKRERYTWVIVVAGFQDTYPYIVWAFVPETARFFEKRGEKAQLNSWSAFYSKADKHLNELRAVSSAGERTGKRVRGGRGGDGRGGLKLYPRHTCCSQVSPACEKQPLFIDGVEEIASCLVQTLTITPAGTEDGISLFWPPLCFHSCM